MIGFYKKPIDGILWVIMCRATLYILLDAMYAVAGLAFSLVLISPSEPMLVGKVEEKLCGITYHNNRSLLIGCATLCSSSHDSLVPRLHLSTAGEIKTKGKPGNESTTLTTSELHIASAIKETAAN